MVEGDRRALLHRPELAQHVEQLLLEPRIQRRQLLELDHQADLAERELDDLLQEGDLLPIARVELAQLCRA